ncbi:Stf0 family sulfotransferase [Aminobacter sp. BE322]|uniref:Stf0 family sulfotransferase n=1 Tax=unclassified Aminobacter TaxID=2644704 RepID=UPI003D250BD1
MGATQVSQGYAICTAPRSGSNYLCQLLAGTELLGRPLEYFNGPGRRFFDDPTYPDDPHDQLRRITTMGATSNGIYGLKLFAHQHDWIAGKVEWTRHLPKLHFVFLTRRDLLGQAISWAKAEQTGQYRHTQSARKDPTFDSRKIMASLTAIAKENARWETFFARNGLQPVRLVYEDAVANPQLAVDRVALQVGLKTGILADVTRVQVRIQRDSSTEAWRSRFLRECRNLNFVDDL